MKTIMAPSKADFKPYTAILRDKRRSAPGLSSIAEWLAAFQGFYYFVSGLWPLVSMSSFVTATGPKTDLWLVQVVGILVTVIGLVLMIAAVRSVLTFELGLLMIGSSLGLGLIDVIYVMNGTISRVYLVDAIEEFIMLALALAFLSRFTHRRHSTFV
jgi:hypothetical protein